MRLSSARETALRALWGTDEFLDSAAFDQYMWSHRSSLALPPYAAGNSMMKRAPRSEVGSMAMVPPCASTI